MQVAGDELHEELLRGVRPLRCGLLARRHDLIERAQARACVLPGMCHDQSHTDWSPALHKFSSAGTIQPPDLTPSTKSATRAHRPGITLCSHPASCFSTDKTAQRNIPLFTSTCQEVSRRETKTACMTAEESVLNGGACQAFFHCVWRAQRTQQQDPEQKCH